jgi:dTDP-glucose 4,6-dehydratase
LKSELGWSPRHDIDSGLLATVRWYLEHPDWIARVKSGAYREWIDKNYADRR